MYSIKWARFSGGELGRLALAILALEEANFLLLDEPTNHLDIPAQETLQLALEAFSGTTLLVSHDRYLVNRMASQIWELRDNQLHVYNGGYQEYLSQRQRESAEEKELAKVTIATSVDLSRKYSAGIKQKRTRRQAERLSELEDQIQKTERRLAIMGEELQVVSLAQDVDEIRRISHSYADMESVLANLLEEWELAHDVQ